LLGLIERWKKDKSPRARQMRLVFVTSERLTDSHRVIFKRLLKQAWHDQDHELMGAFMAVLDRWIRRRRTVQHRWENRTHYTVEVLRKSPRDNISIFSTPTTTYLRRRAWRYFRRLGFKKSPEYVSSMAKALVRYRDGDVASGENLLDNWGLMHACFGRSPVLKFNARHTNLKMDGRLADLQAAPMFEELWADAGAADQLLSVLLDASKRPSRLNATCDTPLP